MDVELGLNLLHQLVDFVRHRDRNFDEFVAAYWAVFQRLKFHHLNIHSRLAHVHHVVVNVWRDVRSDFQGFVAAGCCDRGVG